MTDPKAMPRRCPSCQRVLEPWRFTILRDGARLHTRECDQCISYKNVLANREQRRRRRIWNGE